MRSIVIENVDLMSEDEEKELEEELKRLNVAWKRIGHEGKVCKVGQ